SLFFFFQAEDGIRYFHVTGVQTCALPILRADYEFAEGRRGRAGRRRNDPHSVAFAWRVTWPSRNAPGDSVASSLHHVWCRRVSQIGRASCRERVEVRVGDGV